VCDSDVRGCGVSGAHLLADHLYSLAAGFSDAPGQVADRIIADPQSHVDALVAAGVLEVHSVWYYADQYVTRYEIVPPKPPHVHEWTSPPGSTVTMIENRRVAEWSCQSCPETATTNIEPPS
jgi:hypothetical protein